MAATRSDVFSELAHFRRRGNHPCFRQWNLSGALLYDLDLSRSDLTGADLTGADLTRVFLHAARYQPEQLLNARGLDPSCRRHGIPDDVWDQLLPADPGARNLTLTLLADWEGTLREAIETAEWLTEA